MAPSADPTRGLHWAILLGTFVCLGWLSVHWLFGGHEITDRTKWPFELTSMVDQDPGLGEAMRCYRFGGWHFLDDEYLWSATMNRDQLGDLISRYDLRREGTTVPPRFTDLPPRWWQPGSTAGPLLVLRSPRFSTTGGYADGTHLLVVYHVTEQRIFAWTQWSF